MKEYEIALNIATKAHEGQTDKSGIDYIEHPLTVSSYCASERAKIAALLHDVVEDSSVTLEDLLAAGIGADVIEAVDCLTKREGETLDEYFRRVAASDIAVEVKFADMRHNSDTSRWKEKTGVAAITNYKKYAQRIEKLHNMTGDGRLWEILSGEFMEWLREFMLGYALGRQHE